MATIHLSEGCTLTCSARFARRLREEIAEDRAEKALRNALEEAFRAQDWALYSDLHKEVYGVRPKW